MKTETFPITVTEAGVSAKIRKVTKTRDGATYDSFMVDYFLLGKRKQVWRSDLTEAKQVARDACNKIANGQQDVLRLCNTDRLTYVRAAEAASKAQIPIDTACRDHAELLAILDGKASPAEVIRDWIKRQQSELPRVALSKAVEECLEQARTDRKSKERIKRLSSLERFANDLQVEVHTITPDLVSRWLSALPFAERTRRNYSDTIAFLCRFCVRRGYLHKGTDWLDGVQKYRKRKIGIITTYDPSEMETLLRYAEKKAKDMAPFLAIGAFAGMRHSEVHRLDWKQVDLKDGFIEVLPIDGTKSEERRRLVPIKPNLKAWLARYRQASGPVCPHANTTKQLLSIAAGAKMPWKHNALRHSCISYRIAESGDVARVADESGNSVPVIKSNYLRRVKPAEAAKWFSIMPTRTKLTGRKLVVQQRATS
jgi:integrase